MATIHFTEKAVAALDAPSDAAQAYYWDNDPIGFGVVVGRSGARTFMVRGRVAGSGDRIKVKIGTFRAPRNESEVWTVELARIEARKLLGAMAAGVNPNAKPVAVEGEAAPLVPAGPTLREGMETHLAKMRKKRRAERSITTLEYEMKRYLADWLDRPIAELTGEKMIALHQQIKDRAAKREGTNPLNDKGAPLANRVVAHVSASWRSLNKRLEGRLGSWNPASAVDKDTIKPKRERINDDALPDYAARVASMRSPIRRDGLMFALYTGLRHEDVRTLRSEFVDLDAATARLPDPKGGEDAAFTIPLSPTAVAILERRKRDNEKDLGVPDKGWCFPGLNQKGEVDAISDLRQSIGRGEGRYPVEDVHTLRRTWESVANDEGVSELDQHVLSNHAFGSHNVNATYISQHIGHLAACAAKIDAGLTRRINGTPDKGKGKSKDKARRAHLHSVPADAVAVKRGGRAPRARAQASAR